MRLAVTTVSRGFNHHHRNIRSSSVLLSRFSNGFSNPGTSVPDRRLISTTAAATTTTTSTDSVTALLDLSQSLILQLHDSTSLPWVLTVPLIAIITRTLFTLPFSIYAHRQNQTRLTTSPLLHAWAAIHRRQVAKAVHTKSTTTSPELVGRKVYDTPEKWQKEVLRLTRRKRQQIYRQFGCQTWKSFVGLVQVPVWILASLSVRRLAGVGDWWSGSSAKATANTEAALSANIDTDLDIDSLSSLVPEIRDSASDATAAARAQMHQDGIDGWFTDLLQPDPMFILPILFSLAIFTNVASTSRQATGWQKGLRNGLVIMSIAVLPVTLNTPAVLLLYWSTSSAYSLAQNVILARLMPMPRSVKPPKERKILGSYDKDLAGPSQ
ncbi:hypothetical protein DRE_04909 [Drechslerella stenobrocha 248]|uniref:Mitochondrial inner membrane protein COX18 n=1 Tax=Drechslerella stenobrocha 248 TaxID=1043628 RepID=W7I095_9PEZI|nr:hypothetical protein DRE_04909 [Drechslerella stenobrocha 248]